jgi:soluble lytic murein transglycosylase-like protein
MIAGPALAACIFAAAQTYSLPPSVILAILHVEGGRVGMASKNTNGSYDLGPMQINTLWIPGLAAHWKVPPAKALRMVRDDGCVNIGVGAWILRSKINETGSLYQGIAHYHSATPKFGTAYRQRVLSAMRKFNLVRTKQDVARHAPSIKGDTKLAKR